MSGIKNDIRPLRFLAIQYWCRKLKVEIIKYYPDFNLQIDEEWPNEIFDLLDAPKL